MSWLLSPETDPLWYWARNIVGIVVAVTVVGESFHHIPKRWLPSWLQRDETHHEISRRSWMILVVALALEVPVEMARDIIAAQAIRDLGSNVSAEHVSHLSRHLDDTATHAIAQRMRDFHTLPGTQNPERYDINSTNGLFESIQLANEIAVALGPGSYRHDGGSPMGVSMVVSGVALWTSSNPQSQAAANALLEALNAQGIATSLVPEKWIGCEEMSYSKEKISSEPWCSRVIVLVGDHP